MVAQTNLSSLGMGRRAQCNSDSCFWSQGTLHLINHICLVLTRIQKGLLVKDRENAEDHSIVWLTPSQRKILFPEGKTIDRAHCIVDVLRSSHAKSPCRLSVETIMCLADNGVPKKVFLDLLENSLKELVEPLLDWDSPDAMMNLWCNVCRLGGVMAARRAREDVGRARVNGYSERDTEEIELEDEDGFTIDETENQSVAWWSDEISGCPSSLEETIMYMLDAGFTPRDSPVLRDKLHKFIKGRVNSYVKTYRIDVPMSATAFLVPGKKKNLHCGLILEVLQIQRGFSSLAKSSSRALVGYSCFPMVQRVTYSLVTSSSLGTHVSCQQISKRQAQFSRW